MIINTENTESQFPTFTAVAQALLHSQARTDAAETHGMLCGFICAGSTTDGQFWLNPILTKLGADKTDCTVILTLYQLSVSKLRNMAFDFELLLPADEVELPLRAKALSQWCHGFVTAINFAGITEASKVSEEVKQALQHFKEISKLDYREIDSSEEDERYFFEVVEYARIAVLMVCSELANLSNGDLQNSSNDKTLH